MNSNFKNCKVCGKEMPKNSEICLECGAQNKKPIYTRTWFIVVCVLVGISVIVNISENIAKSNIPKQSVITAPQQPAPQQPTPKQEKAPITYEDATVDDMVKMLKENPLKAKHTYSNKHLKLKGRLYKTDINGKYIKLVPIAKDRSWDRVKCYLENKDQINQVMDINVNDVVELTGKVTDVNETFGYSMQIHSII